MFFLNGSLMTASIYFREVRFFQTGTMMASCFVNNSWREFYNFLLFAEPSRPYRLHRTKGLLETFPQLRISPASLISSRSLPAVSQAHRREMPCPELRGVFVCHQIFIEQLLPARYCGKMKAGMRLTASPPLLGSFTGHFL